MDGMCMWNDILAPFKSSYTKNLKQITQVAAELGVEYTHFVNHALQAIVSTAVLKLLRRSKQVDSRISALHYSH